MLQTGCDISADGFHGYAQAIEKSFGTDVDYGQIVKIYELVSVATIHRTFSLRKEGLHWPSRRGPYLD
jgi:hypothetical protein